MTTLRHPGDPKLLRHPLLRDFWLSERRAILSYREQLCDAHSRDVGIDEALRCWERGPGKKWRAKKAAVDSLRQTKEIERHKYFLSQRLGYDVGEAKAAVDWVDNHSENWRTWWEDQPQAGDHPI